MSFASKLRWSPDGRLIYYVSDRDNYRCLWAQRLAETTRQPVGAPFAVFHFHRARHSLLNMDLSLLQFSVAPDRVVFSMGERTGNVWFAEWQE